MRHFRLQELADKLKGTIGARGYLDQNPLAVNVLTKNEAEVYVAVAARSLFTAFVDSTLWQGVDKDEADDVLKALIDAHEHITQNQGLKQRVLALSTDCLKFSTEQLRKQCAS